MLGQERAPPTRNFGGDVDQVGHSNGAPAAPRRRHEELGSVEIQRHPVEPVEQQRRGAAACARGTGRLGHHDAEAHERVWPRLRRAEHGERLCGRRRLRRGYAGPGGEHVPADGLPLLCGRQGVRPLRRPLPRRCHRLAQREGWQGLLGHGASSDLCAWPGGRRVRQLGLRMARRGRHLPLLRAASRGGGLAAVPSCFRAG
mmetsp:Transcript_97830/g.282263  ORF Transcript_97830/g.282263 Transcript_97830/m.282263 type:complete len:201 (+) Transcript_97830:643-1245(+)